MKKTLFLFVFIAFLTSTLFAVPADPAPQSILLKDGRNLTILVSGGCCHGEVAIRTLDGYTVCRISSDEWVYATTDSKGYLVPSNITACDAEQRTLAENSFLTTISKNILHHKEQRLSPIENNKADFTKRSSAFPTIGKVNLLVILVDFPDKKFYGSSETAQSYFQNMATGENFPGNRPYTERLKVGSIRNYYLDNSFGKLDLQIDVEGPFTLPKSSAYYGENVGGMYDVAIDEMMRMTIVLAERAGVDFTKYDNDNDGYVDAIHVIFAGNSEASNVSQPNLIWPKRSFFSVPRPQPNGKYVENWSCSSEFQGSSTSVRAGIGVTCHELTHVLGLPDWYDTGSGSNFVMGTYSLMDGGPYENNENTPPNLTAIEKEMLNWHQHTILDTAGILTMPIWGVDSNSISYKLTTPNEDEYFILENRQKKDWDAGLKGAGLLIYHVDQKMVDKWYGTPPTNDINAIRDSMGCYIICADNNRRSSTESTDPYPIGTNNSFTDYSIPASNLRYTNDPLNKPITEITQLADSTIQFTYRYNTISLITEVVCYRSVDSIAPLTAGVYANDDTYLWQVLNNDLWEDAPGNQTLAEYKLTEFNEGQQFRRILSSNDGTDRKSVV